MSCGLKACSCHPLTVYQKDDKGTKVNARDVSDENIRNFKNKLCQVDWDNVCNSISYSCFIDEFNSLYNDFSL